MRKKDEVGDERNGDERNDDGAASVERGRAKGVIREREWKKSRSGLKGTRKSEKRSTDKRTRETRE